MIPALMTNKNKPSVRIVAGSVKRISNGLTTASSKDSTMATKIAVKKSTMKNGHSIINVETYIFLHDNISINYKK